MEQLINRNKRRKAETMKKLGLLSALLIFTGFNLFAQTSCFDCHGDSSLARTNESGVDESLFVHDGIFKSSVHGSFTCIDCHTDATGDPHPGELEAVKCSTCHEEAEKHFLEGIHGKSLASGDSDAPTCADCHGKHDIFTSSDTLSHTYSVNQPKTCARCHENPGVAEKHDIRIAHPIQRFEKGVHGHSLAAGNDAAATCSTCHEPHLMRPSSDPESPVNRLNISKTCGECHGDVEAEYEKSIHGTALADGILDAPTCTYCHSEHEILSPADPNSPTAATNLSEKTCAPCHGLLKLNEKYGIIEDPVNSYRASYHGLATERGSKVAANCASCHGVHNILPQSDPMSTIHVANLTKTCGTCHPNASEQFAQSYIHASDESLADSLSEIIKEAYIWLIVVVIGGMVLHNLVIYSSYVRAKLRALRLSKTIQRFSKEWVLQHVLMFISFTTLVITGFALKFPDAGWARLLTHLGMTEYSRGLIHRIAAVVMLGAGFYHIIWLAFAKKAKGELKALLPGINDVRLFIVNMKFHLGLIKERPNFQRYGYIEKAEYWALVWGTVIMAVTGFVLWFPTTATYLMPSWIIKVSETIHYYEAWLATLAILLYHMFFAIFHPADYPINLTGFTGKITEEEAEERFPAWYEEVKEKEAHKK